MYLRQLDEPKFEKPFNNRPIVWCVICLILGILLTYLSITDSILAIILGVAVFLFAIFAIILCKRRAISFFAQAVVMILFFLIGGTSFVVNKVIYDAKPTYNGEYFISGNIESVDERDDCVVLILENCKANIANENIVLKGKTRLQVDLEHCSVPLPEIGANIVLKAQINTVGFIQRGEFTSYYYKHNIKYSAKSADTLVVYGSNLTGLDSFREDIRKTIMDNMPKEYPLAYALVFGDTTRIDETRSQLFNESGLTHIFAVSGLHVVFLVVVLSFALKKFNRYVSFSSITGILVLYCVLCGFSPSIVRATIMSVVLLFAKCLGKQYDLLNALALSAIVILVPFAPFLFDAGMQLSYMCILSMAFISPVIRRLLLKLRWIANNKVISKLASSFSVAVAVSLGTLPVVAKIFESFPILSIVVNVIAIPIVSFLYLILIIFLILALIIPPISSILVVCDYAFYIFEYPLSLIFNKGAFLLPISSFKAFAIPYYFGFATLSDYVFLSTRRKIRVFAYCLTISLCFVLLF